MLAGTDNSRGIWVSQNLTTERGTSWGPAEENKAQYERLRRLSGCRLRHLIFVEQALDLTPSCMCTLKFFRVFRFHASHVSKHHCSVVK